MWKSFLINVMSWVKNNSILFLVSGKRRVHKIEVLEDLPNSYLVGFEHPPFLTPGVWGGPKGGPVGFSSLCCSFLQKVIKITRSFQYVGGGSPFWDHKSGYRSTWAPCPSESMVTHFQGEIVKQKLKWIFPETTWSGWMTHTLSTGVPQYWRLPI